MTFVACMCGSLRQVGLPGAIWLCGWLERVSSLIRRKLLFPGSRRSIRCLPAALAACRGCDVVPMRPPVAAIRLSAASTLYSTSRSACSISGTVKPACCSSRGQIGRAFQEQGCAESARGRAGARASDSWMVFFPPARAGPCQRTFRRGSGIDRQRSVLPAKLIENVDDCVNRPSAWRSP